MNRRTKDLRILLIEDEPTLQSALTLNLKQCGYEVVAVAGSETARQAIKQQTFHLALCDVSLPDGDGKELISWLAREAFIPVVGMSGFADPDFGLAVISAGADDFLSKPFPLTALQLTLDKVLARRHITAALPAAGSALMLGDNFLSEDPAMLAVCEKVGRIAQFQTTVLITGESGTGKEVLARSIHQHSPRKDKPFVPINCGAIPSQLMESELFGHKKGAFTDAIRDKKGLFEEADGGTVFLDEIGELPMHLQVKLLRVLQEQQIRRVGDEQSININVRIIAATLRDLDKDVAEGMFRDDLFYRLNVVSFHLPALRERRGDIALLSAHFINKISKRLGIQARGLTEEARQALINCNWRGNVRELENCIERALVLSEGPVIDVAHLPQAVREPAAAPATPISTVPTGPENISIKVRTRELEIDLINKALKQTNGNRTHAAKILELSHRALLYKLKEYNLG